MPAEAWDFPSQADGAQLPLEPIRTPGSGQSSVAHPKARDFSVGKIGRGPVADYAAWRGISVPEVGRWLAPNLGYEPDARE